MWRSKARVFLLGSLLHIPSSALQQLPFRKVTPPLLPLPFASYRLSPSELHSGLRRFLSVKSSATAAGFSQERGLSEEDTGEADGSFPPDDASWSAVSDDKWDLLAGKDTARSVFNEISDDVGSLPVSADGLGLDSTVGRKKRAALSEDEDEDGVEKERVVSGVGKASDHENDYDFGADEWEGHQEETATITEVDMDKVQNVVSTLQNALPEVLESMLDEMDLVLNEAFVMSVLQAAPASSIDNLITFFRYTTGSSDFLKRLGLFVEKIHAFRDLNRHGAFLLWDLVRDLGQEQKGSLNSKILNHVISIFSRLGIGKSVVEVFNKFEDLGYLHDGDTYYHTILALGKPSWADTASTVCEKMIASGKLPDGEKVGKLVRFFCKGGKLREAHRVYVTAKDMGKNPPTQYLNLLVHHLSNRDDTLQLALEILEQLPKETLENASSSFLSAISGLCRTNNTTKAKSLLERMIESGVPPRNAMFNDIITALCKAHEIQDAVSLLKKMEKMKLRPDIRAYNVIMAGFCKGGLMEEAQGIFDEAKKVHKKLGRVSYHILSRGYCRVNEYENAINCMHKMKEEGIEPNIDDYRKMIQTLCLNAMDWKTAETLLQEMTDTGLSLDGQTLGLIFAVKQLEQEEMHSVGLIPQN